MKIAAFALASALAMTAAAAHAQETGRMAQDRKYNQQARIAQGVRSGELTRHEARHIERQEHAINREERNMRAANGGYLTRSDRAVLQRQQNVQSRRIYNQKHDGQVR
jgi:hypothetical protein